MGMSPSATTDANGNLHARTPGVPGNGRFVNKARSVDEVTLSNADGERASQLAARKAERAAARERRAAAFGAAVDHLREYVGRTGTAIPPLDHTSPDGFPLGKWVSEQRVLRRRNHLTVEDIEQLEQLPGWSWTTPHHDWIAGVGAIELHIAAGGDPNPAADDEDATGYPVGAFAQHLRSDYHTGLLAPEKIARMEQIPGWKWSPDAND